MSRPGVAHTIRTAMAHPASKAAVQQAVCWDDSQVSRVLSGSTGVVLDKLDALFEAVDYVVVSRDYLQAVTTLGRIGLESAAKEGRVGL